MLRHLLNAGKIALGVLLLAGIVWHVWRQNPEVFAELWAREKRWWALLAAFGFALSGVGVTFWRWQLLVRAVGIPFSIWDALRLGSVGYLLSFVTLGGVGGDLFKAVFLAHEHPDRKTDALATIVLDRWMGLYGLCLVCAAAAWSLPLHDQPEVQALGRAALVAAIVCTVMLAGLFIPGVADGGWWRSLEGLPWIGPHLANLHHTAVAYRSQPATLLVAVVMSLGTHLLNALSLYAAAATILTDLPTFTEHLLIAPLAVLAASLPLTPAGLGAFEGALEFLYRHAPQHPLEPGQGLAVALASRVVALAVAAVGLACYLSSRDEVAAVLEETAAVEDAGGANLDEAPPTLEKQPAAQSE